MVGRAKILIAFVAALTTAGLLSQASAQETVKIGANYPLSGNAASAGSFSKAAIELAVATSSAAGRGKSGGAIACGDASGLGNPSW